MAVVISCLDDSSIIRATHPNPSKDIFNITVYIREVKMPIIPALRRLRREGHEFEATLDYVRS